MSHDVCPCHCIIVMQGDSILNQALSEIGGKGLFTKELDVALLDKSVSATRLSYAGLASSSFLTSFCCAVILGRHLRPLHEGRAHLAARWNHTTLHLGEGRDQRRVHLQEVPNAERSTGWVCDWVRIFATPGTVAGHEPYLQGRQLPRQRPDSLEEDREW